MRGVSYLLEASGILTSTHVSSLPANLTPRIRVNFVKVSPADLANPFPAAVAGERIVWNVAPDDVVQNVGVALIAVVQHRTETTRDCYNGQG